MSHPSRATRRTRRLTKAATGLTALLVGASLAACSGSSAGGSPDQANLRVGVIDSVGVVPLDLGLPSALHSFSDAGLNVTTVKFDTEAQEIAALSADKIDIAYGEYSQFLNQNSSIANTGKIRVVAEAYDAGPNTVAMLVGKGRTEPVPTSLTQACNNLSIAVTDKYSPEYLALANWFQTQGFPISTNCRSVKVYADPTQAIAAVAAGDVQAVVLEEPYVTSAQINAGLRVAEDLATGNAAAMPLDGYFASTDFTSKYPRSTAIFSSVMAKLQALGSQRVYVENALNAAAGIDPLVVSTMQYGTFPTTVLAAKLDIVLRLMNEAGTISGMPNSANLTDVGTI